MAVVVGLGYSRDWMPFHLGTFWHNLKALKKVVYDVSDVVVALHTRLNFGFSRTRQLHDS